MRLKIVNFISFYGMLVMDLSTGRIGFSETPQCDSTRRLTSRPRKAECISVAGMLLQPQLLAAQFL
jgi:hypothetical protein